MLRLFQMLLTLGPQGFRPDIDRQCVEIANRLYEFGRVTSADGCLFWTDINSNSYKANSCQLINEPRTERAGCRSFTLPRVSINQVSLQSGMRPVKQFA